ncbi:MAG: hypothetical protein CMP49_02590 [Flavobacteriales bacterium]|nr:hypothetical protein [Flavobacteriales bacterium]|tara:strand:- start:494 stop:1243 length:750 start_codon:yes stop_codon:yes gene_type:complete
MKFNYRFLFFLVFFLIILFFLTVKLIDVTLKNYTRHNTIIKVPSLVGFTLSNVEDTLSKLDLEYVILDSAAYNPNYHRGSILSHDPKAGNQVKPGRKIYLTINPFTVNYIPVPDLANKSLRQGISLLESNAFRVGNLHYIDFYAKNLIRMLKAGDNVVTKGDSLPKFTIIDIYLGDGYIKEVAVPDLSGLELGDIKRKLNNYSLNLGNYYYADSINDTLNCRIYQQEPLFGEKVPLGSYISIWLNDSLY